MIHAAHGSRRAEKMKGCAGASDGTLAELRANAFVLLCPGETVALCSPPLLCSLSFSLSRHLSSCQLGPLT